MSLQIPPQQRQGLSKLGRLETSQFDALLSKLSLRTGQAKVSDLEADISSVEGTTPEDATRIVRALISMHVSVSSLEESNEEYADRIIDSLQSAGEDLERSIVRETFKSRLVALLSLESLRVFAKAIDLQTEYERVFCTARIMTDLRPVFGSKVGDGTKGAVLVHILQLTYHPADDPGAHSHFQVALDSKDLKKLRAVLERAEEKQKSLEATLSAARIARLAE